MVKRRPMIHSRGFSLVEMLVALVFTMILMAGMAAVFKTSLSTFYTSGEILSSARRNRMSVDLLGDDLNAACMYLTDLSVPPTVGSSNPPFYILPNMPIAGTAAAQNDPLTADQLFFYMDQPLPFEGTLNDPTPQPTAVGATPATADVTFNVTCPSEEYALQVRKDQIVLFKDAWEASTITSDPEVTGKVVTIVAGADPNAGITGTGSTGIPKFWHLPNSGVVFIRPAQMIRYSVVMLQLNPSNTHGIPCLVRDQGNYDGSTFMPNQSQQIITENVSGFKVYLSATGSDNTATTWAGLGLPATTTGFAAGWDATTGIRGLLDTQLASSGRPDYKTTRGSEHWFRSIPTLVRVDVTTRTATQRTEYATAANTAAFKNLTQSLIFVPRHSGLTMN